uniref:Uncharacterized protein n=1 Tax=Eiseniibacteriota bacterium TaxID=2212470 RepID=A0A832I363_UNCEI
MLECHHCRAPITLSAPLPRDAECAACGRDLRCCLNCRHYDPRMNNACRETEAEPVVEKDRRNFCEFFEFSREPFRAGGAPDARAAEALRKLEGLFGGPAPERKGPRSLDELLGPGRKKGGEEEARKRLEELFGPKKGEDERAV